MALFDSLVSGVFSSMSVFSRCAVFGYQRRLLIPTLLACLLLLAPVAYAADITLSDTCSLANAIRSANGDSQVAPANECATGDSTGADSIVFVANVRITEALPAITSDINLIGGYSLGTPPSADGTPTSYNFSLLTINSGTVSIRALELGGVTDSAIKVVKNTAADVKVEFTLGSIRNRSTTSGGAFYIDGGATVEIYLSNLTFNAAEGGHGGVIYAKNSTLRIERNNITSNRASGNGGAVYFLNDSGNDHKLTAEGNNFRNNRATDNDSSTNSNENGGAIYIENGTSTDAATSSLVQNAFSNNAARNGGAVYQASGKMYIDNSTLDENSASDKGGSVYAAGGTLIIRHATIVRNKAATGAGVGVFADDDDTTDDPTVDIFNSIVAENTDSDTENAPCLTTRLNTNNGNIIDDPNCAASQAEMEPLRMELVAYSGTNLPRAVVSRFYRLLEGSPAIDNGVGTQGQMLSDDQTGHRRPEGEGYDSGSFEFDVQEAWPSDIVPGAPEPDSPSGDSSEYIAEPGGSEVIHTCVEVHEQDNGIYIYATYGLKSGVQCQQIDASGIGIQSIIDAGFVKAVDIWSYVEQGVQVCFDGAGPVLFLDAATVPRTIRAIDSFIIDSKTCTSIWGAGSIVLQNPQSNASDWLAATAQPLAVPIVTPTPICMTTATAAVNVRDAPNGNRIGGVFPDETLRALGSVNGWYQVDYAGRSGWISADYVTLRGQCDFVTN